MPTAKTLKFTAIVTCYNRESLIRRTLESISKQGVPFDEIIVVDDKSLDNSISVIEEFFENNKLTNFKLIKRPSNGGQNAALNDGINASSGDVICFIDSDDAWKLNYCEVLHSTWNNYVGPEVGLCYGRIVGGPRWKLEGCDVFGQVLTKGYLSILGTISIRKTHLEKILPLRELPELKDRCQDDRICFELARISCIKLINEEVLIYQKGEINSSSDSKIVADGWNLLYRDYQNDINEYAEKNTFSHHMITVGGFYFQASEYTLARNSLQDALRSIEFSPTLLKLPVHLLKIFIKEIVRKII